MEDDYTNESRAARALEALTLGKYQETLDIIDPSNISDLVADLLHLARSLDFDTDDVIETAKMNFDAEIAEEHVQEESAAEEAATDDYCGPIFSVGPIITEK